MAPSGSEPHGHRQVRRWSHFPNRSIDMTAPATSYYFVCRRCEAKWFAPLRKRRCPRCGKVGVSREQLTPPWHQRTAIAINPNINRAPLYPFQESNMTPEPTNCTSAEIQPDSDQQISTPHLQPADSDIQEEYRREHLAQLRRRACPGCGDGEPIF